MFSDKHYSHAIITLLSIFYNCEFIFLVSFSQPFLNPKHLLHLEE